MYDDVNPPDRAVTEAAAVQEISVPPDFTGENTTVGAEGAVDTFLKRIQVRWERTHENMLLIAEDCAEANRTLSSIQKQELQKRLPFGASVFSKLAQIGADARLKKPEVLPLLPRGGYSILYEATKLSDELLNRAIAEKIFHPGTKRASITRWVNANTGKKADPGEGSGNDGKKGPDVGDVVWVEVLPPGVSASEAASRRMMQVLDDIDAKEALVGGIAAGPNSNVAQRGPFALVHITPGLPSDIRMQLVGRLEEIAADFGVHVSYPDRLNEQGDE